MRNFFDILTRAHTPRLYSFATLGLVFFVSIGFIALNLAANDFGLWYKRDQVRIWALEKTSKYLLAHRYVPEHFDAIMIGASVSANMDTRRLEGARVYNLSMSGGNITETGAAARQYLNAPGNHKWMIVTLHPYMTKNSGMKSFQINEREYWGSLFSLIPLRIWLAKIQDVLGYTSGAFDESLYGWNNFNFKSTWRDPAKTASEERAKLAQLKKGKAAKNAYYGVDQNAVSELDDLIKLARAKGVKVIAYYFPIFGPTHDLMLYSGEWADYREKMDPLFEEGEIVLDLNQARYDALRYDYEAYHDSGHLSQKGANEVLDILNKTLKDKALVK